MLFKRFRPRPWTATLLAAALLIGAFLLVGWLLDRDARAYSLIAGTEDHLDSKRIDLDVKDLRFEDAIEQLRDLANVTVRVDWPRAKLRGVTPDARVSGQWRGRTVREVTDNLVTAAGLGGVPRQVDRRGRIVVSDQFPMYERRYECLGSSAESRPDAAATFLSWLSGIMLRDPWQGTGGEPAMRFEGRILVVHHSVYGHYRVQYWLERLREVSLAESALMNEPWVQR